MKVLKYLAVSGERYSELYTETTFEELIGAVEAGSLETMACFDNQGWGCCSPLTDYVGPKSGRKVPLRGEWRRTQSEQGSGNFSSNFAFDEVWETDTTLYSAVKVGAFEPTTLTAPPGPAWKIGFTTNSRTQGELFPDAHMTECEKDMVDGISATWHSGPSDCSRCEHFFHCDASSIHWPYNNPVRDIVPIITQDPYMPIKQPRRSEHPELRDVPWLYEIGGILYIPGGTAEGRSKEWRWN